MVLFNGSPVSRHVGLLSVCLALAACTQAPVEPRRWRRGDGKFDRPDGDPSSGLRFRSATAAAFDVVEGTPVFVALEAKPSTGYRWFVEPIGASVTPRRCMSPMSPERSFGRHAGWRGTTTIPPTPSLAGAYRESVLRAWRRRRRRRDDGVHCEHLAAEPARPQLLTKDDNGRTVRVTLGTDLVVKLPANSSTGYAWKVTRTDRSFGYPRPRSIATAAEPRAAVVAIRGGSRRRGRQRQLAQCHHQYARPWTWPMPWISSVHSRDRAGSVPADPAVHVTADDNGSSVDAIKGQDIVLEPGKPPTGYKWSVGRRIARWLPGDRGVHRG